MTKLKKGFSLSQAREQTARLHAAGIDWGAHLMLGCSGQGKGRETALRTAELLNETHPTDIINVEMFVHRGTELFRQISAGEFLPAGTLESLEEERTLIENLRIGVNYDGFHGWHEFHVWGQLPEKRAAMLRKLDAAIARCRAEMETDHEQVPDTLQRVRIHIGA